MASPEQRQVEEFHRATGSTIGDYPAIRDADLRVALIQEEVDELVEAIESGDIVSAAKEIADILYVVHGTSVSFGLDMEPVFNAVHENNMTKVGGGIREDGKVLKPEGYRKVDIGSIVISQTLRRHRRLPTGRDE